MRPKATGEGEAVEEADEASTPTTSPTTRSSLRDRHRQDGEPIEVADNETILDAGAVEGWDLPSLAAKASVHRPAALRTARRRTTFAAATSLAIDDGMEEGYFLLCRVLDQRVHIETGESPTGEPVRRTVRTVFVGG